LKKPLTDFLSSLLTGGFSQTQIQAAETFQLTAKGLRSRRRNFAREGPVSESRCIRRTFHTITPAHISVIQSPLGFEVSCWWYPPGIYSSKL